MVIFVKDYILLGLRPDLIAFSFAVSVVKYILHIQKQ